MIEQRRKTGRSSYELRKKKHNNKIRTDLTCAICGEPTKWTQVELSDKRYEQLKATSLSCDSPKCKSRIRAWSNSTKKGTKLSCEISLEPCEVCGKIIVTSPDKDRKLKVCGITCQNTILGRRAAENKRREAAVECICIICGKTYEKPQWYANTASKKCDECRYQKINIPEIVNQRVSVGLNHKVVRIEILEGLYDTGDITVEKYSNFALDAGIIVHNSNKSALSEENILFARTIVAHQKYLSHQVTDLIEKIYAIIEPEDALTLLDNVHIAFPPPKSLQFEREARYMNELASLVETLERIGIPKEWAKKKYLTGIDWDDLEKYETNEKIEKSLGTKKDEEGAMGGGGYGGY